MVFRTGETILGTEKHPPKSVHNFFCTTPQKMILAPLESWRWEFSNAFRILKNGYNERRLWSIEVLVKTQANKITPRRGNENKDLVDLVSRPDEVSRPDDKNRSQFSIEGASEVESCVLGKCGDVENENILPAEKVIDYVTIFFLLVFLRAFRTKHGWRRGNISVKGSH